MKAKNPFFSPIIKPGEKKGVSQQRNGKNESAMTKLKGEKKKARGHPPYHQKGKKEHGSH